MNETILTIMCGLPRVGKSTWIKENKGNAIIVSPDDIRKECFGHQFHAPANKFVFGIAENMTTLILQQGHDVIVDATHITLESRRAWKGIANSCVAKVKVVWVYASKNQEKNFRACLERNELSSYGEKLPMDALLRMANFFEEPDPSIENWYELIEHQNPHKRKLPLNKRIKIENGDGLLQLILKGEKLWGVAVNREQVSNIT